MFWSQLKKEVHWHVKSACELNQGLWGMKGLMLAIDDQILVATQVIILHGTLLPVWHQMLQACAVWLNSTCTALKVQLKFTCLFVFSGSSSKLILITKRFEVGKLADGSSVYRIDKIAVVPLSAEVFPEIDLDVSIIHEVNDSSFPVIAFFKSTGT